MSQQAPPTCAAALSGPCSASMPRSRSSVSPYLQSSKQGKEARALHHQANGWASAGPQPLASPSQASALPLAPAHSPFVQHEAVAHGCSCSCTPLL